MDIKIDRLCKSYGEKKVLKNLTLTLKEGEMTCIKGRSGYGKTTLLRVMSGLEKADSGSIEGMTDNMSFVFQEDRLCEDFSAVSNIRLVTGKSLKNEDIIAHLIELGLEDALKKPLREYSGGMKRRVAIARAICRDADIVLMDEPFKGLDLALRKQVMDYVKKHCEGKTVICVTHEPDEAEYMGARLIDLEDYSDAD